MTAARTYRTTSATIVLERTNWRTTVVAVSTASCRRPVEFPFDRSGRDAAEWLAGRDLTDCVRPGQSWGDLCDAVAARAARVRLASTPAHTAARCDAERPGQPIAGVSDELAEEILRVHYAQMLRSPEQRRVVSQMIREAATLEKAAKIRQAAR